MLTGTKTTARSSRAASACDQRTSTADLPNLATADPLGVGFLEDAAFDEGPLSATAKLQMDVWDFELVDEIRVGAVVREHVRRAGRGVNRPCLPLR